MTSKLIVDSIEGRTGATVSLPQDSNYVLDQWRLNTNFTSNTATINAGWERPDHTGHGRIGTGMTESSGIFTFPSTGLWMVTTTIRILISGADQTAAVALRLSTDSGSSEANIASVYLGDSSANDTNQQGSAVSLINVTDASTFRLSLRTSSLASGTEVVGDTGENATTITFERKGPSQ